MKKFSIFAFEILQGFLDFCFRFFDKKINFRYTSEAYIIVLKAQTEF